MAENEIATGFFSLENDFPAAVADKLEEVADAIEQSYQEHNRQYEKLYEDLCMFTELKAARHSLAENYVMVEADEYSRGEMPVGGAYQDVGWPLFRRMIRQGITHLAQMRMTVAQANTRMIKILQAHKDQMTHRALCAVFQADKWSYEGGPFGEDTAQYVYGLANYGVGTDSRKYEVLRGATSMTENHNHLLATASAISDLADPYPAIYTHLAEHPENGTVGLGDVVALIPDSLETTTKSLTQFQPMADPNMNNGMNAYLIGTPPANTPGVPIGYHKDGLWISKWSALPAGYIVAYTRNGRKPIAIRQDPRLKGLIREGERRDYPFYETSWSCVCGAGAWNAVGAVVQLIGAGAYVVPSGYAYNSR